MRLFVTKESAWRFSADQSVKIFYESPGLLFLRFVPPTTLSSETMLFGFFLTRLSQNRPLQRALRSAGPFAAELDRLHY